MVRVGTLYAKQTFIQNVAPIKDVNLECFCTFYNICMVTIFHNKNSTAKSKQSSTVTNNSVGYKCQNSEYFIFNKDKIF